MGAFPGSPKSPAGAMSGPDFTRASSTRLTELDGRLHVLRGLLDVSSRFDQLNETIQYAPTTANAALDALAARAVRLLHQQAEAILDMPMGWQSAAEVDQLREERDRLPRAASEPAGARHRGARLPLVRLSGLRLATPEQRLAAGYGRGRRADAVPSQLATVWPDACRFDRGSPSGPRSSLRKRSSACVVARSRTNWRSPRSDSWVTSARPRRLARRRCRPGRRTRCPRAGRPGWSARRRRSATARHRRSTSPSPRRHFAAACSLTTGPGPTPRRNALRPRRRRRCRRQTSCWPRGPM